MIHNPIQIRDLEISFPGKFCFSNFSSQIVFGDRIAIIGRNGSGKSSLVKNIADLISKDINVGYVPQIINDQENFSGGERFNKSLTTALNNDPAILLLDEPTNHLDARNRKNLLRMLQNYWGTLIVVSHDLELLNSCISTIWQIADGKIQVFNGNYGDFAKQQAIKKIALEKDLQILNRQKDETHQKLMQEQQRASKSRAKGEKNIQQSKWPTMVSQAKARRAEETSGRKKSAIEERKQELIENLKALQSPETIVPKFSINSSEIDSRVLVQIKDGEVGYVNSEFILKEINLTVFGKQRLAFVGDNGSGKSTIVKAILNAPEIHKAGAWSIIKAGEIGYLDQHYRNLDPWQTALETIMELRPDWSLAETRKHLNDFLFRKNEEVFNKVSDLSGGEKARLSLAQISAKTPRILILDEVTNNLDCETREHCIQILQKYPGALIVISHDADFLAKISVTEAINVAKYKR